jgi:hypothetical protein
MARIVFNYRITKEKNAEISKGGYDIRLLFRTELGQESEQGAELRVKKLPHLGSFPLILSAVQIRTLHVRLRITRHDQPESGCFTVYRRLALPGSTVAASVDLGSYRLSDNVWKVSGAIVPEPEFDTSLERLKVKLQIRSGELGEDPLLLDVTAAGEFSFSDRRMLLNPEKTFESAVRLVNEADSELARHYSTVIPGEEHVLRIRVGAPFLDSYDGFRAAHPTLVARLERFAFDPKQAHANDDAFIIFRRWTIFNAYQIAEGVVSRAGQGPAGDPDFTWDVRLDPFYDSDEGFRLPNENNRIRHGGLHVEACRSLSREKLPDGLTAASVTVPAETRVWMMGSHVFDDAQDFGSRGHEHNELHPLYVMEECMGGWFHFATLESIALSVEALKDDSPPRSRWPWTETSAEPYREAYLRLNARDCRDEIAQSYNLIVDRYRRDRDDPGLADFFADTSIRYARLGVDLGVPLSLSPQPYREAALEMLGNARKGRTAVQSTLVDYLVRLFSFLYGPPSYAQSPIKGPAPQSFLRCVYAMENEWASAASGSAIGEANPRASLNRATARKVDTTRVELQSLYAALFDEIDETTRRSELFAEAVMRYRNLAIRTARETDAMDATGLREFAANAAVGVLADEMNARVDKLWGALTPYARS